MPTSKGNSGSPRERRTEAVASFLSDAAPRPEFASLAATTARRHNIVGVGIGPKIKKGKQTKTPSIRFYVEKKVPLKSVPSSTRFRRRFAASRPTSSRPADFDAQVPIAQQRLRPADGGCSVGLVPPAST